MKFGIIGALGVEIEKIKNSMKITKTNYHFDSAYFVGTLEGHDVVLVECGIGKIVAAVCAYTMVEHYHVDYLINTGIAGAIDERLKVLDVVIGKELLFHDINHDTYKKFFPYTTVFKADELLVETAAKVLRDSMNISPYIGRIATGDEFVSDSLLKKSINEKFAPLCVEMEGAAIAQVAFMHKTPFLVIRTMSDSADDAAEETYDNLFDKAAAISSGIVMELIKQI